MFSALINYPIPFCLIIETISNFLVTDSPSIPYTWTAIHSPHEVRRGTPPAFEFLFCPAPVTSPLPLWSIILGFSYNVAVFFAFYVFLSFHAFEMIFVLTLYLSIVRFFVENFQLPCFVLHRRIEWYRFPIREINYGSAWVVVSLFDFLIIFNLSLSLLLYHRNEPFGHRQLILCYKFPEANFTISSSLVL